MHTLRTFLNCQRLGISGTGYQSPLNLRDVIPYCRSTICTAASLWQKQGNITQIWEFENVNAIAAVKDKPAKNPLQTGDRVGLPKRDLTRVRMEYENCDALKDADPILRTLCSLEYGKAQSIRKLYTRELLSKVQRYESDSNSLEVRIARLTAQIRTMRAHVQRMILGTRDGLGRERLVLAIKRRNKYLRRLREWDYNKFCFVLEQLDLEYHGSTFEGKTKLMRKEIYHDITVKEATLIRKDKFEKYHQELKKKQAPFLERKGMEMAAIDAEEKSLREALAQISVEEEAERALSAVVTR